jgi:hypothetical protein
LDNLIVEIKTTQHKEIPAMRKDKQKQLRRRLQILPLALD